MIFLSIIFRNKYSILISLKAKEYLNNNIALDIADIQNEND